MTSIRHPKYERWSEESLNMSEDEEILLYIFVISKIWHENSTLWSSYGFNGNKRRVIKMS